MYHNPVLLHESIEALNVQPTGNYADVTFGGGGHSREILKRLSTGKLLALDQDSDALGHLLVDDRFIFAGQNFRYLKNFCQSHNLLPLQGILADLGVSSHQFDTAVRGFSTRLDGPLDMRMDQDQDQSAVHVLNSYPADQLQRVFGEYGEITNAATLASFISIARLNEPIVGVNQFKRMIQPFVRRGKENQYYAQVFQAIRIEVNHELEALEELLLQSVDLLIQGGRMVVISYHSLEDRLVKKFFNTGKFHGMSEKDVYGNEIKPMRTVFRKAIIPTDAEKALNSRSRSAKMRVAEKI